MSATAPQTTDTATPTATPTPTPTPTAGTRAPPELRPPYTPRQLLIDTVRLLQRDGLRIPLGTFLHHPPSAETIRAMAKEASDNECFAKELSAILEQELLKISRTLYNAKDHIEASATAIKLSTQLIADHTTQLMRITNESEASSAWKMGVWAFVLSYILVAGGGAGKKATAEDFERYQVWLEFGKTATRLLVLCTRIPIEVVDVIARIVISHVQKVESDPDQKKAVGELRMFAARMQGIVIARQAES